MVVTEGRLWVMGRERISLGDMVVTEGTLWVMGREGTPPGLGSRNTPAPHRQGA